MEAIITRYFKTNLGELILGTYDHKLCLCDWRYRKMRKEIDNRIQKGLNAIFQEGESPIIEEVVQQLNEYLNGNRALFDIPLLMVGSEFQKKVWLELLKVPFGKTLSYLELSRNLGNQLAIRAVASANGANAISIFVPCHRIIGSDGKLVGYAGGLGVKRKLLQLEGGMQDGGQLRLFER
jgi:methylated-DNA-[protein]-cysteine S-methyltransferase